MARESQGVVTLVLGGPLASSLRRIVSARLVVNRSARRAEIQSGEPGTLENCEAGIAPRQSELLDLPSSLTLQWPRPRRSQVRRELVFAASGSLASSTRAGPASRRRPRALARPQAIPSGVVPGRSPQRWPAAPDQVSCGRLHRPVSAAGGLCALGSDQASKRRSRSPASPRPPSSDHKIPISTTSHRRRPPARTLRRPSADRGGASPNAAIIEQRARSSSGRGHGRS